MFGSDQRLSRSGRSRGAGRNAFWAPQAQQNMKCNKAPASRTIKSFRNSSYGIEEELLGMFEITCLMLSLSVLSFLGLVLYTSVFTHPHKKKSYGVMSGLLGGHS